MNSKEINLRMWRQVIRFGITKSPSQDQTPVQILLKGLKKKVSYQVSDENEVIEEKAVYEDGYQVYHSVAHKKKMKRLEKLKKSKTRDLASMKEIVATRFVLTKVMPEMAEEDVERYLLENFDEIKEVYIRKNDMRKHNYYSTFVFIVNSQEEIEIDEIVNHNWPGKVMCFFTPNDNRRRY